MRENIGLYRGKRKDNGEWIYGFYYQKPNPLSEDGLPIYHGISDLPPFGAEVDPETVGEYTSKTDKNGKKIFEGDIVKTECDLWHGENKKERVTRIGVVVYDEKFCQFGLNIEGFSKCFTLKRWKGDYNEVIGNVWDNPELLQNT